MEIINGKLYYIAIRFPWGELRLIETTEVYRDTEGTLRWRAEKDSGLSPYIDCPISETEESVMGWLGGSCDTLAVLSSNPDALTGF